MRRCKLIERLATTPYGTDAEVDQILDHADRRLQRDPEPGRPDRGDTDQRQRVRSEPGLPHTVSVGDAGVRRAAMLEWLAPEVLDLHGYATPTLIEATTKPHNPSIEYDLWLKWNQGRIDANEAALNAVGLEVQRPINDWCSDGDLPPASGMCPDGDTPSPAKVEGWDDYGPFYAAMYAQQVGLNSSTVEMCQSVTAVRRRRVLGYAQYVTSWSTPAVRRGQHS